MADPAAESGRTETGHRTGPFFWALTVVLVLLLVLAPLAFAFRFPILCRAVRSGNPRVQRWAVDALGSAGPAAAPHLVDLLSEGGRVRKTAYLLLARMGADAVPALVDGLQSGDGHVRKICVHLLAGLDQAARPALPALRTFIKTKSGDVAACALDVILAIDPSDDVILGQAIGHEDGRVRLMACGALRAKSQDKGTFSPKALPWLLRAVGRKDPNVLTMVAKCVETVRPDADRETVLAVIGCLGHDDDTVRCLSAKALGRIGHVAAEGSLAALRRALLDENEGVREAADLAMRQVWKNVETPPAGDLDRLETVP